MTESTPSLPPVEPGQSAPATASVAARGLPLRWAVAGAATIGVAALALAVWVMLGQSHAGTASAAWLPADVVGYAELSSDLTPDQQARVSALLKHFPGFEDQARLGEKLDETLQTLLSRAGVDYAKDVKPWLGSSVAMAGRALPAGTTGSSDTAMKARDGVVLVASTDDAAASRFVQTVVDRATSQGATVTTQAYRDVPVTTVSPKSADGQALGQAIAIVQGRLVAGDPDLVRAVIDVRKAGAQSLEGRSTFRDAIASLPADRVGAVWLDVAALAATTQQQLQSVAPAAGLLTFSPDSALLGTIRAEDDGLVVEVRGRGSIAGLSLLSPSPGANAPHAGRLAASAPASSVVFVDLHDVGTSIRSALDAAKLANPSGPSAIADLDKQLAILGTSSGELAAAVGDAALVATLDAKEPRAGIVLEVKDQALAQRLVRQIGALATLAGVGEITSRDYKGVTIQTFRQPGAVSAPGDVAPAFALDGDVLIVGSAEAVVEAVVDTRRGGAALTSDADFTAVTQRVRNDGPATAFVDLAAFLEAFAPASLTAEERAFLTPLHAVRAGVGAAGEREWLGSSRLFVLVR